MRPPIPNRPEPLDALRARYAEAVGDVHDGESIALGLAARPGELPRHVFDFEDGLRLIVSRDAHAGHGTVLHVSASFEGGSDLWRRFAGKGHRAVDELLALVVARFRDLSGDAGPLEFIGLSGAQGIPHWVRREPATARA